MNFYCYAHSALRKPIRDLAINQCYPKMAVCYDYGTIQEIAIPSLARTAQHRSRRTGIAFGLTWSSDGTTIYSTNEYGHRALHWVNGLNQSPQVLFEGPIYDDDQAAMEPWDGFYPTLIQSDRLGKEFACDSFGDIKRWNANDLTTIRLLSVHNGHSLGFAFHPTQAILASCSMDRTIGIWDEGDVATIWPTHRFSPVVDIAWSSDGASLLCTGSEPQHYGIHHSSLVQRWNPWNQQLEAEYRMPYATSHKIAIHPSQPLVAIGHLDHTISIWHSDSWQAYATLKSHYVHIDELSWSHDGQWLISIGSKSENYYYGIEVWAAHP
ncbi:WD40 repeat domain-containing protein [Herpetosiphon geysericola]|uniref:Uncharacterized protein n=1 Tax=Herpetosiphon geysericola TaxID=70996 RepID=A0A0N8GQX4_9CHLR|nr:WD40 repeat domain-containing protein [Herpetosiphon geysericola]KPL84906.1 hypothetical protein SE18_18655 [Herpetosiphon geysericola]